MRISDWSSDVCSSDLDNPVFYVQYAHARICSLERKAKEAGVALPAPDLSLLGTEELPLIKIAAQFPSIVESAAQSHEQHRVASYLGDLAAAFHAFWNMGNDRPELRMVLADARATNSAGLFLAGGIGQSIRNGVGLVGGKG